MGDPTTGVDANGVYYVNIPKGETNEMDSAWVTAAIQNGGAFAKRGEGLLSAGDAMASFTKEIRVEEGVYKVTSENGLGTVAGATSVSNNATLYIYAGSFGNNAAHAAEPMNLAGNGYGNQGALRFRRVNNSALNGFTLLDDARLVCDSGVDIRQWGVIRLEGHTLTLAAAADNWIAFVNVNICRSGNTTYTGGDIVVERGVLEFQDYSPKMILDMYDRTLTVKPGAVLRLNDFKVPLPWHVVMEPGAVFQPRSGTTVGSKDVIGGQVTLKGDVDVNEIWSKETSLTLRGKVTGDGALNVKTGYETLRLESKANDFTNAVTLTGLNSERPAKLDVSDNSLPVASAGVTMDFGSIRLKGLYSGVSAPDVHDLPPVACTANGDITVEQTVARSADTVNTVRGLAMTGAGTLALTGPMAVTGRTHVASGTLKLSTPSARRNGLDMWYRRFDNPQQYITTTPDTGNLSHVGIDPNGPTFTYKAWTEVYMGVVYQGYLWIDGDESVTWNFASLSARHVWLRIDDQDIIHNQDLQRSPYSWFTTTGPVTLAPGSHKFYLYMGNNYNSGMGPRTRETGDLKWTSLYGVAYNPNVLTTGVSSNSADYVAFTGGQFTPSLEAADTQKASVPAVLTRATFPGGATFGPGTTFDINDAAPFVPVEIDDFAGVTTVENGELRLTGIWTLSALQATAGALTSGENGRIVFDNCTLDVGDLSTWSRKGATIVKADGGTVVGVPMLPPEVAQDWLIEVGTDGSIRFAGKKRGLVLTIR